MAVSVKEFRDNLLAGGALTPEGIHHEFVGGAHGRKLDFDSFPSDSSLFEEWVEVNAREVHKLYVTQGVGRLALVSVAEGTDRLVPIVAAEVGHGVVAVITEKVTAKSVRLTKPAREVLRAIRPATAVALEDVGTAGTTSASAVTDLRQVGVPRVEVLNTWQRQVRLPRLEEIGAAYNSIIKEVLPTLVPKDCTEKGYCAQGWQLILHE